MFFLFIYLFILYIILYVLNFLKIKFFINTVYSIFIFIIYLFIYTYLFIIYLLLRVLYVVHCSKL